MLNYARNPHLYSLLINPSYPLANGDDRALTWYPGGPPVFVRRRGKYALFVFFYAPLLLNSVRRRGEYETLC